MNNSLVKEVGTMAESQQNRRPRIVRQRGVAGVLDAAYSQLYRLLLLVVPLR
jgi:hypothetical protein